MTQPVVTLHTIEQWYSLDPLVRAELLQRIKIKDRLLRWLKSQEVSPHNQLNEPKYVPCRHCNKGGVVETKGWVLLEPRYPGIHPSQISSPCLLKVYNEMMDKGKVSTREAKDLLILDLGKHIHDMFQSYGERGAWGPKYQKEVSINPDVQPLAAELYLEGSADAENYLLIDDIPNSPAYEIRLVHEYKSIKKENFEKLAKPKPEHREQAMIYCAVLNAPVVVYLYLNKNDSSLLDFPVEFDHAVWGKVHGKAQALLNHYDEETPPPGSTGYHCNDCSYVYDCPAAKAAQKRR